MGGVRVTEIRGLSPISLASLKTRGFLIKNFAKGEHGMQILDAKTINLLQTFWRRNPYSFDKPIQPTSKLANIWREEELAIAEEHLTGFKAFNMVDIYGGGAHN